MSDEFDDVVNMTPAELERWLDTDESRSVGQSDGGESVGNRRVRVPDRASGPPHARPH
ncbi:DUF3140 domain-containing protein [Promicromonospora sukumoe]|uniref:DUF3140 domain-containing protein n=1 Tax=Promicromonospora sukumoe TaxID=88382 RepID=UPI000A052E98|nr:DUF3140 domain-containing protein [Promicromonospora sukumoe]